MKSLDHFKSLSGPLSGSAKNLSSYTRPSSDSISSGSFANLKLTAGFSEDSESLFFVSSGNLQARLIYAVDDPFVCRKIDQRAGFRQNRSGNSGTINESLSPNLYFYTSKNRYL